MNSKQTSHTSRKSVKESQSNNEKLSWIVVVFILIVILATVIWFVSKDEANKQTDTLKSVPVEEIAIVEKKETLKAANVNPITLEATSDNDVIEEHNNVNTLEDKIEGVNSLEPEEPVNNLPALNESDSLVENKLPELTFKKELLKLFVTKDIIRRFVVFTDNFTRGSVAYEHSLFIPPKSSFSAKESISTENNKTTLQWDKSSSERFNLYADLLRSLNTDELVSFYVEVKPLIDEAYNEVGYDNDFTETLQLAIAQILNAKAPNGSYELSRTSVMFTYKDDQIESLSDAQKILLRIGEDNIIVIKSVLLDISAQLKKIAY